MFQLLAFNFFFCDGPVISDFARSIIYGYLLFDCLLSKHICPPIGNTPLQAHILLRQTHPLFWCIQNKFSTCFLFLHKYKYLQAIVLISKISWFCCIVGFGGVVSRLFTGILVFILSTTISGIGKIGVSHRWHVPTWALLTLIFTKYKTYSIDSLIQRYISNQYNLEPDYLIFNSGFSSKIIQFISLYTLFAAAVSKLRNSGIRWVHPGNLTFYMSDPSLQDYGLFSTFRHQMRTLVIQYPSVILIMSISSLLVELTSIFGMFISSVRILIVSLACLFHFGIWFLMTPNYFPQCVCYLMLIDIPYFSTQSYDCNIVDIHALDLFVASSATIIIFGFIYSLIFRYEGWPFTSVPMFSLNRLQFTHDYLIDEDQLKKLAKEEFPLLNGICVGGEDQFSEGQQWIRITKNDEDLSIIDDICVHVCVMEHAFRHSLWSAVIRSILISKDEIDIFTRNIFHLLASDDIQLIGKKDFINVQIHFRDGWKTYSTAKYNKEE